MRSSVWDHLKLRWNDDVDTLGQTFGEDVRYYFRISKSLIASSFFRVCSSAKIFSSLIRPPFNSLPIIFHFPLQQLCTMGYGLCILTHSGS